MVEQQVQFYGAFGALILCPIVERGAEVDQGGVEADQRIAETKAAELPRLPLAALIERLKHALIQLPGPMLVGIGQSRALGSLGDSQVTELAFTAGQSTADLAQGLGLTELADLVNALALQILLDSALTEFFVFLAQAGVGLGKSCIVEIAVLVQTGDDRLDRGFAAFSWLHASLHQAAEIGFGAHLPAKSSGGVREEARLVEKRARLAGFALEGQLLAPSGLLCPLVHPVVDGLVPELRVLRLEHPVPLVGKIEHLARDLE